MNWKETLAEDHSKIHHKQNFIHEIQIINNY